MRRFRRIEAGSYYSYLSEGCRLCRRGAKLVLFVTGLCNRNCYYCPISEEKRGKDVVFANEREVKSVEDFVEEIELMDALGVAITGGEPLLRLERVLEFLRLSGDLHAHLYTSVPASRNVLEKLKRAGLDEIRFHPVNLENVKSFEESVKVAKSLGLEVGLEIPALRFSRELAEFVNRHEIFLNVNELEFSSTNYDELVRRGYEPNEYYGAKGCDEVARMYAEVVEKFHYCTARFKDRAQMRRRFIRMAMNHPEFYDVTREGTLICGFIEGEGEKIEKAKRLLMSKGQDFVEVEGGIETSAEFVETWGQTLKAEGLKVSIIERYPTSKRIVVEVIPL